MKKYVAKLVKIIKFSKTIKTFRFELDSSIEFESGQDVILSFRNSSEKRVYSISSVDSCDSKCSVIDLTIKLVEGGVMTSKLFELSDKDLGMEFNITGPFGKFMLGDSVGKPLVFLASGMGITPIKSILTHLDEFSYSNSVFLFYSAKKFSDLVFFHELSTLSLSEYISTFFLTQENKDFDFNQYNFVLERMSIDFISNTISLYNLDLTDCHFFICGGNQFVNSFKSKLLSKGVGVEDITYSSFG